MFHFGVKFLGVGLGTALLLAHGCADNSTVTRDEVTEAQREVQEELQETEEAREAGLRELTEQEHELAETKEQIAARVAQEERETREAQAKAEALEQRLELQTDRDELVRSTEARLAEVRLRLDQSGDDLRLIEDESQRERTEQQFQSVRTQIDRVEEALGELKSASLDRFEEHRAVLKTSLEELDRRLEGIETPLRTER